MTKLFRDLVLESKGSLDDSLVEFKSTDGTWFPLSSRSIIAKKLNAAASTGKLELRNETAASVAATQTITDSTTTSAAATAVAPQESVPESNSWNTPSAEPVSTGWDESPAAPAPTAANGWDDAPRSKTPEMDAWGVADAKGIQESTTASGEGAGWGASNDASVSFGDTKAPIAFGESNDADEEVEECSAEQWEGFQRQVRVEDDTPHEEIHRRYEGHLNKVRLGEGDEPNEAAEKELFASRINTGINFQKYSSLEVNVNGENVPPAVGNFQMMGLHDSLLKNITKSKYVEPTPVQAFGIPIAMAGRDVMGCAQTGSGKTAAFLLPAISICMASMKKSKPAGPLAVVITPTRELATQIFDEARRLSAYTSLRPVACYGGTSMYSQINDISKGCHLLIGTPGRMKDLVEKELVDVSGVKFLIVDEFDRMMDQGFEPEIREIASRFPDKARRQTMMFSATSNERVQENASYYLRPDYIFLAVGIVGGACSDVKQTVSHSLCCCVFTLHSNRSQFVKAEGNKRKQLVKLLNSNGKRGTLIFVNSKVEAHALDDYLFNKKKFPCNAIHGDKNQMERERALSQFKKRQSPILIATAVAERGLDIANCDHVINYDMPKQIEEYVHRIGRTARVGNTGTATSFYDHNSSRLASDLVKILQDAGQEVPDYIRADAGSSYGGRREGGFGFGGHDSRSKGYGGGGEKHSSGGGYGVGSNGGYEAMAVESSGAEWGCDAPAASDAGGSWGAMDTDTPAAVDSSWD